MTVQRGFGGVINRKPQASMFKLLLDLTKVPHEANRAQVLMLVNVRYQL